MWFMRTAIEGEIYVRFMGVACTEKANAENIVKSLKSVVSQNLKIEWSEFNSKMVSVACDGASVMLGVKAGVAALLKKEQPCLIPVHCMAHRLELALKDSVKAIKLYQKTVSVLAMGLYYFYHNSPLNRSMLERSFIALKSIKTDVLLVPVRVGGTRWVQHTVNALQSIHGSYRYIMQHLGQNQQRVSIDSKSKATAFMRLLKSKDVLCFIMLLLDVLIPLRRLSLLLQEQSCLIGKQHTELGATIEVIRKYKSSDGPYLRKVVDEDEFQGTSLTHCNAAEFASAKNKFLEEVEKALLIRFAEFSNPSVVQATRIADIQSWPLTWEELKVYGDKELETITDHFHEQISVNAEIEWTLLKKEIHDQYFQQEEILFPTWKSLNLKYKSQFAAILKVMDLISCMSPSSAEAERGFSQLKNVKTSQRNKLGQTVMNHCLAIRMLSCGIKEFDPVPAIDYWNGSGIRSRRPNFKDKKSKPRSKTYSYQLLSDANVLMTSDDASGDLSSPSISVTSTAAVSVTCTPAQSVTSSPGVSVTSTPAVSVTCTPAVSVSNEEVSVPPEVVATSSNKFQNFDESDMESSESESEIESELEEDRVFDNLIFFSRD